MLANERAEFIETFMQQYCKGVMETKGTEYSRGEEDVNSNFKRVAADLGMNPQQVLWVYMRKHLDSIAYFVKTGETKSEEPIEGRVGDAVNYLLILASLIEETRREGEWVPERKTASQIAAEAGINNSPNGSRLPFGTSRQPIPQFD